MMALICSGEDPVSSMAFRAVLVLARAVCGPVARDVEEGKGGRATPGASGQNQARNLSFSASWMATLRSSFSFAVRVEDDSSFYSSPKFATALLSHSCSAASAFLSFLRERTWASRSLIVLSNSLISASV